MKPGQLLWKGPLFGLLAVLLLGIALIPWLIGDTSRFADQAAAELSAWTGGKAKFTGAVRVSIFPDVSVRGPIELTDSTRLPMMRSLVARDAKISLDLVDLLRGRVTIDALRLLKPRVTLRTGALPEDQPPEALLVSLLTGAPVRVLHVRKGRIKLPHGGSVRDVYAHFDGGEETGALSGFGSFTYKDGTVRYSLESGAPILAGDTSSVPIALTLTSKLVNAKITATASLTDGFKLDGDMQAKIDDLRKFIRWVGIDLPDGQSLQRFSAEGAFHLSGSTLAFDDGTFILDGNKAVGLLAVTAAPVRPRIEGTLAFDRLGLDPYLGISQASSAAPVATPIHQGSPFDGALLQYFDADLRISAAELTIGGLKLGHGGFTVTAKDGSVTSEVSELELCGGSADGRMDLDLAAPTKPLNLVADLTDVVFDSCLAPLGLAVPLSGTGGLKTEITTEGKDAAELTRNLTGTLKVKAHDGAVPLDFARLMASTPPLDGNGWSFERSSSFDQLDADCRLSAGHISCQTLRLETPSGSVAGAGDVDLPTLTLDWSLSVANPAGTMRASELTEAEQPTVLIRGSLSQPMIRRADRPALGEGSVPVSPIVTQALPH
jgi:AsmA protein